jgi:MFS family permease
MSTSAPPANSADLERDARAVNARRDHVSPGDIVIGVIIGRTSEFFDFFVYAIASVLVFPAVVFPYADPLTGTLYSFALFSLAFVGRPVGTLLFTAIDRRHGRGTKLTIALLLLGGSTMAISLLPGHAQVGALSAWLLGFFRFCQGIALGGAWDGLPSLLSLNAPRGRRGWFAMVPQLGAPLGLLLASALFAYFLGLLSKEDFLSRRRRANSATVLMASTTKKG